MNVSIRPQLEKFIDDQVKAGRYASTAEALEAGVARLMLDPEPDVLDQQDIADIRLSLDEMRRGDVVDSKDVHQAIQRRYLDSH